MAPCHCLALPPCPWAGSIAPYAVQSALPIVLYAMCNTDLIRSQLRSRRDGLWLAAPLDPPRGPAPRVHRQRGLQAQGHRLHRHQQRQGGGRGRQQQRCEERGGGREARAPRARAGAHPAGDCAGHGAPALGGAGARRPQARCVEAAGSCTYRRRVLPARIGMRTAGHATDAAWPCRLFATRCARSQAAAQVRMGSLFVLLMAMAAPPAPGCYARLPAVSGLACPDVLCATTPAPTATRSQRAAQVQLPRHALLHRQGVGFRRHARCV